MPWDTGLFDCFSDCKVCLVSWLCATCQVSYQKAAVEEHECGCGDWIPVCFCPLCCVVSVRGKIREKYSIDGSCCGDLCTIMFCGICSISQQTRQLDMKGAKPAGMFMQTLFGNKKEKCQDFLSNLFRSSLKKKNGRIARN